MGRKEVYECDRCATQVDVKRAADGQSPPKVEEYMPGWRAIWVGAVQGSPSMRHEGTYCPGCVEVIEAAMARVHVAVT